MSRSGYSEVDDWDEGADWRYIRWRGAITSALRGKKAQAFLRELIAALDALPEKRLIANSFIEPQEGCVCALGAVGKSRGIDLSAFEEIDPDDDGAAADAASGVFGIPHTLAATIMDENDEGGRRDQTPEERFARMRRWAECQLIEWEAA